MAQALFLKTLNEITEHLRGTMGKKEPKGVNPAQAPQRAALERMVKLAKELVQAETALLEALALPVAVAPGDPITPEDWETMIRGHLEEGYSPAEALLTTTQQLLVFF